MERTDKKDWVLVSPNHETKARVCIDRTQGLILTALRNGRQWLRTNIVLETDAGSIGNAPVFTGAQNNFYDETYPVPAGKEPYYTHCSNELILDFIEENIEYSLYVRALAEGVAYRIELRKNVAMTCEVISEPTCFYIGEEFHRAWLQTWVDTYEGPYEQYGTEEVTEGNYGMPCLFQNEEKNQWLMLTEANLINSNGSYCSCHLQAKGKQTYTVCFAPEQEQNLKFELPDKTPWRVIMMADNLQELIQNHMVFHLNPASEIEDKSFIVPGRSLWSWWSFENGAQLYTEQKKYVDMAAAYGFESITVDAGWDDTWVAKLCDYARERNVLVWLWSDMQSLDSFEKAAPKIEKWASWGVAGLKVDFFMNDSSTRMGQYNMIADIMTKNRLMINFHGNTKPCGEGRTWPNLLTEEGIMGLEHYKWSDMPDAKHNCTVPFTRNVIGPMDYTPTGFSNKNRNTTLAHQLALSIVFDTGVIHIAESIHSLIAFQGTDFLRRTHGVYDETRLLDGYPGSYVVMLRRKGGEWYIGIISVDTRVIELDFSFLPTGTYQAQIYQDAKDQDVLNIEKQEISSSSKLELEIHDNGGAVIYAARQITSFKNSRGEGFMTMPLAESTGVEKDKQVKEFDLNIQKPGLFTIRIWYRAEGAGIFYLIDENEIIQQCEFEQSGGSKLVRTVDVEVFVKENWKMGIHADSKSDVEIDKIQLIDNKPQPQKYYPAQEATLKGNAKILPVPEGGGYSVQGVGNNNGSIIFDQVEVAETADYIIAIDYYSGENRALDVSINNELVAAPVLFNSGGWETGHFNIAGRKEILVLLKKGKNTIEFSGRNECAHFKGISVFKDDFRQSERG